MLYRRPRRFAVVLENENVAEPPVLFQIQHTVAKSPKHVFHCLLTDGGQRGLMIGSFNDDFMGSNTIHLVKQALTLAIQIPFNAQGREFIGDYPKVPSRTVSSTSIRSITQDFRRRFVFISVAKWAKSAFDLNRFFYKIARTFAAISSNDYPSPSDWIFSQFRQVPPQLLEL